MGATLLPGVSWRTLRTAQLAAVLGHEIAPVARHPRNKLASRSSRIGPTILGFLTAAVPSIRRREPIARRL